MKYTIKPTSKFQKDLKKAKKRGCDIDELKIIKKKLLPMEKNSIRSIKTILLAVIFKVKENVI